MVELIFCVVDRNHFFVIAVVMDGQHKGGATAMVGGYFNTALQISRQGYGASTWERRRIGTGIECTSTAVATRGGGRRRRRRSSSDR